MPNLLGQSDMGYLVEDDNGNVFNLPDPPNIASMSGVQSAPVEPLPSAFTPNVQEMAAAPLVGAEPAPQIVPVTKAEAAPIPQPQQPKAQAPTFQTAFNDQSNAVDMMADASAQRTAIESEQATAEADLVAQRNARIKEQAEIDRQKIEVAQKNQADAEADTEAAIKDYNSTKVDAGKLWADKSTASKWGLALSLIASGWASANTGKMGENPALSIWLNAVDRDIKLQQQAKADKLNSVGLSKDKASSLERVTQNTIAQASLQKAAILEDNARELELIAARMKPGKVQTDHLNAAAHLLAERGKLAMSAAETIAQDKNRRAQTGLGYANLKESRRQFDLRLEAERQTAAAQAAAAGDQAMAKEIAEKGVPDLKSADGKMYLARGKAEATKVAEHYGTTKNIVEIIDQMDMLKRKHGAELWGKAAAEMDSLGAQLATSLRVAQQMGTLDNGAIKALNTQMGIPEGSSFGESDVKTFVTRKFGVGNENASTVLLGLRDTQVRSFNNLASSMRSPLHGDYKSTEFRTSVTAPTEKTPTQVLGDELGRGSEGGRGYVDDQGKPMAKQVADMTGAANQLPASYENYTKIKTLFDQANAKTGNSPAALAQLSAAANNPQLDSDTRRTASMALSAIGKVNDLDQIWKNKTLSELRGVDYRDPDQAKLFDTAKNIAKRGQGK